MLPPHYSAPDLAQMVRALQALQARHPDGICVQRDRSRWWHLTSQLALALNHPGNTGPAARVARSLLEEFAHRLATTEEPCLSVQRDVTRWWCLMSQWQLALRHPGNTGEGAEVTRGVLEELAEAIAAEEPLKTLYALGWDPPGGAPAAGEDDAEEPAYV
jgi:hypothetical protein